MIRDGERTAGSAEAANGEGRLSYLLSTCKLLWPPPATVTLTGEAAGGAPAHGSDEPGAQDREFLLLLGKRRPRLLVPASRRAGAASMRGYSAVGSSASRLGGRAVSFALASGIGAAAFRSRVRVHAPPGADTIESHLRDALGSDILVSLYLGPARANRKPILQVVTPQGQFVGFAKIGTTPLTRALVHAEYGALTKVGRARVPDVTIPQVLHYGEWHGLNVLLLSALPVWLRRHPVTEARLAAAMNSVSRVDGERQEKLGHSSYLQLLTKRLTAADQSADRDTLLDALGDLSARAPDTPLVLGSWHGDWTPWNMAATRIGLLVWDWERFTSGVPLGLDALHYRLQKDVVPGRREPRAAATRCIAEAPAALAAFGIGASDARITATLYLADLATRYLSDRQAQAGAPLGAPGAWLIPAIKNYVGQL